MTRPNIVEALRQRTDRLERRVQQVEDSTAIYRLLIDLQTAMDERDLARYASFYTEDGEWCAVSGRAIGPARIAEFLSEYCKPWESESQRSHHSISDVEIDVDGDWATASGQWTHNFPSKNGGPHLKHFGRFDAVLTRTSEGWRIRRRASYALLPYIAPKFQLLGLAAVEALRSQSGSAAEPREARMSPAAEEADEIALLARRAHELSSRIRAAEDRDALYRLFIDIQMTMDGRDLGAYGLLYAEDGEWCAVNGRAIGPAGITRHLQQYCKPWPSPAHRTYHTIADVTIDLDGDRAAAQAQWQHYHPDEEGRPVAKHFGRFEAVAARTSLGWRLKRRASFLTIPYVEPKFQLVGSAEGSREATASQGGRLDAASGQARSNEAVSTVEDVSRQLDELDRRFAEVEDRAAIYRLFLRLQEATDGRDGEAYGACFAEDGEWSGVTGKAEGRAEIIPYMSKFMTPWESEEQRTFHSISDFAIDLDGDRATAKVQYRHYRLNEAGEPEVFHFCHYEADLKRTSEGWLFKRRDSFMDLPYVEPKFQVRG